MLTTLSVRTYHIPTGHLLLEHNYPRGKSARVAVDINAVLDSVTSEELRVGSWVHVLGYVRRYINESNAPFAAKIAGPVYVDAVVVFSAGAIVLGDYERILRDAQEVDRRVARPA
ncbi:nuclear telomere cap complex subunit Ten1 [Aspergillus clavatus NRRL 1]|uniref:Uncharacterized protein n=1 Tax=Aspergillus clavatus (strain ATCC 1007 / CBS 513.65 / DSM 816 / NCTC 3887 / NRRL 1 / QM 1276 / 107) TaxID=344612 RepID=A1CR20_ASPCL|nr:uncharacterized protein ACLA_028160 [Aspergillus clavatus NRRL 1]EAW08091.1 conserved hypothetical protein [Aspergillus clavatus NRRL 1]